MSKRVDSIQKFLKYVERLKGDEKGEAQVFCDRLFIAFGHEGYKEAGATLEERIKAKDRGTSFADLLWPDRVLIEMKKRGVKLRAHFGQAHDYWDRLPYGKKPPYIVLCNFDEFLIYDMSQDIQDPVDSISTEDLHERFTALNFLFPVATTPLFGCDRIAVTRAAAAKVAAVFHSLVKGRYEPIDREIAQRFVLQCVTGMYAEDMDLLPRGLFSELIDRCKQGTESSYDAFGSLFRQMNNKTPASAGRYRGVPYFNGGLFEVVDPIELTERELELLAVAAAENWTHVKPPIFGTLFQDSMDKDERHAYGAHFTSEVDIMKVVGPSIVRPWREEIEAAETLKELITLRERLIAFRILDPACGSGNFLYVAYREIKRLEMEILAKIHNTFGARSRMSVGTTAQVSTQQLFGIDRDSFAVELAKLTLMVAKTQALGEARDYIRSEQMDLPFDVDQALPLDNLDANITCRDALFVDWPKADAIIGNPPYQSKNKMQKELGALYVGEVRERYRDVPGRADYCVYWFRRAHDELADGGRAGLVGTNTIRQNYSREGGLDHIVGNGGTITEAVSTQVWSGDAVVHVSIVNWIKGEDSQKKRLHFQLGDGSDSPWETLELEVINSSLSRDIDLAQAKSLTCNTATKTCFQGQTHGHEAFLLSHERARALRSQDARLGEVLFPFLIADDMLRAPDSLPSRQVIDFSPRSILEAATYGRLFERVKTGVLPDRQEAAKAEAERNAEVRAVKPKARVNHHHRNFLASWWMLSYPRGEMLATLGHSSRYIVCARVTKRPIFEFVHHTIRPNDALAVFSFSDDYSFGILQSEIHWAWFTGRCSTLKRDFRYTNLTVYNSFPWPQTPSTKNVQAVAEAGKDLRSMRREVMETNKWGLRELYRTLELPGNNPLRDAHAALDAAVRRAYGMKTDADILAHLLDLNLSIAAGETPADGATPPGLPSSVEHPERFVTNDCIQMDKER